MFYQHELAEFRTFFCDSRNYIINQLTNTFVSLPSTSCMAMTDCNILADPENMEAVSTAHVLAKMMAPQMMGNQDMVPTVIATTKQKLISSTPDTSASTYLVVLCTRGCLESYHFASWLLQARRLYSCHVYPVIGDDAFQIPSPWSISQLLKSSTLEGNEKIDVEAYSHVVKAIFLEIALPFLPAQSSEDDLAIKAKQVVYRVQSGIDTTLNARLVMVDIDEDMFDSGQSSFDLKKHWGRSFSLCCVSVSSREVYMIFECQKSVPPLFSVVFFALPFNVPLFLLLFYDFSNAKS